MKPRWPWAFGLFLLGILLVARPSLASGRTLSVDDVRRLHSAGVSEDIIISEIVVTGTVFDLQVDELLSLQQSGISDRLLQFMVDTGRDTVSRDDSSAADTTQARSDEDEDEADLPAHPRYFVTLNWGYPAWWYDTYWSDYWYYGCGYDPWYVSWSWPCHGWYPTWWYGHSCWAPAYWGYRHQLYRNSGWGRNAWTSWDRQGWTPNRFAGLSESKYKLRDGSSGKLLYADAGLRTGDLSHLVRSGRLEVRSRPEDLALGDHQLGGDVRRPVRATWGEPSDVGRGGRVRQPAGNGIGVERGDVRRPTHLVRHVAPYHSVHRGVRRVGPGYGRRPPDVSRGDDGRVLRERVNPPPAEDRSPRVYGGDRRPAPEPRAPRASNPPPARGDRGVRSAGPRSRGR